MTLDDFLNHIEAGGALNTPEIYRLMDEMSDEARRITCEINNTYHSQEELRALMSRLLGKPVDETFKMFPPFYTDFGRNITIGRLHQRLLPFPGSRRCDIGRRLSHRPPCGFCHTRSR